MDQQNIAVVEALKISQIGSNEYMRQGEGTPGGGPQLHEVRTCVGDDPPGSVRRGNSLIYKAYRGEIPLPFHSR